MEYQLKVCGLTRLNQIKELIELKIDFLGFIFYEKSPRFVLNHLTLEQISEINHQGKVGVFVNEDLDEIVEISEQANLNFIQLHGDETEDFISQLRQRLNAKIRIIKVIRIANQTENLESKIHNLKSKIDYILFDTDSKAFGGTGKTFDWKILNEINIPLPYFLSGGISLENINQLSTINYQPVALDINSKFEIEAGNKDLVKIKKLINQLEDNSIYVIKKSDKLNAQEIKTIQELWEIDEWKSLSKAEFAKLFSESEFHLLLNQNNQILSLMRLNFDFNLEIQSQINLFPEVVGLVSIIKGKGYGSKLLKHFKENIINRNLDVIGFCEKDLRPFYSKNEIEILKDKARFIQESQDNQWVASEDDDILIFNLAEEKKIIINELNEENLAYFIN